MPTQYRVGREQRAELLKQLAAENLSFDGQPSALVVIELDSIPAKQFLKHLNFGSLVLDDSLLLTVDPACENQQQQLPRLQYKAHACLDDRGNLQRLLEADTK